MNLLRLWQRAWGYYNLYGARRFAWAVAFKAKQAIKSRPVKPERPQTDSGPEVRQFEPLVDYQGQQLPFQNFFLHPNAEAETDRSAADFHPTPFIALIGDLNLPQCKKYRVLQKLEAFAEFGIANDYSHCDDLHRALNILQFATFAIFYRARDNETFRVLIKECERLKIPYAYDIDDPIFSETIYRENPNLAFLTKIERENLLASSAIHLSAMQACPNLIVSTPRLVAELETLGFETVFLWRNAIDAETQDAVALAQETVAEKNERNGPVRIVYASGSRAHEADFRTAEKEILAALEKHSNVELHIIGYLNLPKSFERFDQRIFMTPFSDYVGYIRAMAAADISVIPLVKDAFNDCKSAIRYMEASLVKTPTIVSKIGDFTNLVKDGETGFLADDSSDWTEYLDRLIEDAALRSKIANKAEKSVRSTLTVQAVGKNLNPELKELLGARL